MNQSLEEFLSGVEGRLTIAQNLKKKGNCAAGVRAYVMDVEPLLKIASAAVGLERALDELGYLDAHGCLTGDCPHEKEHECTAALLAHVEEAALLARNVQAEFRKATGEK